MLDNKKKTENKEIIQELAERLSCNYDSHSLDEETKRNMAINKIVLINLKKSLRGEQWYKK
ncbi:hypothetical protein [Brachyspira hyodysenteriae]|uniref:hypothetical protein n=1 Tax=Brachyspira hyodysenteriae TaxID=159 RepID=UPI00063DACC4|nr:hypothetical protein [Brachyspira hyodysenteriae]KLI52634.1 hypothetical protein SZ44_13915 [Brachyspira hyodysenteriae]MCZ9850213.1 hypothetical protein [Brachyspira hyodysenteriae]MCZ9878183.1 hypothetical protein [Brachyspira hyodysenteriae]MCZ9889688.1 hypothetical protein [Brachyspira hyodysenteriae]MCZ9894631.1 hypothetical protein [Brachyspira hyodysenteriae]